MSVRACLEPLCQGDTGPVELIISGRPRDLGGFSVRRVLPSSRRRSIGPVIFFDHMGPAEFEAGQGINVRPHPHIGLATVTYLFDGAFMHRDSLGSAQLIEPGAVNWMIAGRGIVHSERAPPAAMQTGGRLHGIQTWVALPADRQEAEPAFSHHPRETLPLIEEPGLRLRLLLGAAFGERSPVPVDSPFFYLAGELDAGASLGYGLPDIERALYVVDGEIAIGDESFDCGQMLVLRPGAEVEAVARRDSRVMLLGGPPIDAPRHMVWNFVSTSPERIERAKEDWRAGRFDPVPGDDEFIPLPE